MIRYLNKIPLLKMAHGYIVRVIKREKEIDSKFIVK